MFFFRLICPNIHFILIQFYPGCMEDSENPIPINTFHCFSEKQLWQCLQTYTKLIHTITNYKIYQHYILTLCDLFAWFLFSLALFTLFLLWFCVFVLFAQMWSIRRFFWTFNCRPGLFLNLLAHFLDGTVFNKLYECKTIRYYDR